MRRSLIWTTAATVSMVLLAMLIPMAVLVRNHALEDRLARAALEVQATETVVSGQDKGSVAVYLDRINRDAHGLRTTVLYPDGTGIGPIPGEDGRVREARQTGRARVDDLGGGAEILVPVALGGTTAATDQTPVIRVEVLPESFPSDVHRAWLALSLLGIVLLGGALLLADRLGRSFVTPIRALAADAQRLGGRDGVRSLEVTGPAEVRELAAALNRLVERIEVLLTRERDRVADLSHRLRTPITALRLGIDQVVDAEERDRLSADLDRLEQMVDHVVREARRSEREGVAPEADGLAVLLDRVRFWEPLAEDQERAFAISAPAGERATVRVSEEDLVALADVLLDNVFTHTPDGAPVRITLSAPAGGGVVLVVEDGGPGLPGDLDVADRGTSGAGSTGLGLAIATRTAVSSGGRLSTGRSSLGGARVRVELH